MNNKIYFTIKTIKRPPEDKVTILCPFCSKNYTASMLNKLWLSEGSYTPDCVGSRMMSKLEITCDNCKKLVYVKETAEPVDYLEWEKL